MHIPVYSRVFAQDDYYTLFTLCIMSSPLLSSWFIMPKDRIPSRAQRTILPPHCYPFLFDGNLRSGVIYFIIIIFFLLLCFFGSRESGAETLSPYNVAKTFIWRKIRPWEARMFVTSFNEILLRPRSKICVCKLENICVRNHASYTSHT